MAGIHMMYAMGRKASSLSPFVPSELLTRKIPSKFCSPEVIVTILTIDPSTVEKGDLYGKKKLLQ